MTNADKRTVTTDALETLGTIITEAEGRDAIHLAVENVVAAHDLLAGEHIGFDANGLATREPEKYLGIVDPFLAAGVAKGEHFWLVVYPRQITSLRHVWTHPAFVATEEVAGMIGNAEESELWIRRWVDENRDNGPSYKYLMSSAENFCDGEYDGDYLHIGEDAIGLIHPEFWKHFEIVTGKKPKGHAPSHFSCSC